MKKIEYNKILGYKFVPESISTKLMIIFYENCQNYKAYSFRQLAKLTGGKRNNIARSCRLLCERGIIRIKNKSKDNVSYTNQYKWIGL